MATAFLGIRTTRSKHVFSPYAPPPDPIQVFASLAKLLEASTSAELDKNLHSVYDSPEEGQTDDEDNDIEAIPSVDAPDALPPEQGTKHPPPPEAAGSNSHRHGKRQRKRHQTASPFGHSLDAALKTKVLSRAEAIQADCDAATFPAAKNAYTARRESHTSGARKTHRLQDLDALGLQRIEYKPG